MKTAVIIILLIITGACLLRLYLYRKEIKSLTEQIDFIYEKETNSRLTVNYNDKNIIGFVNRLNDLIQKYRNLQISADNSSKKIKNDFTSLSHDIRTPLTAISGYFQLLCDSENEEERQHYTAIINERIKSIESILESIFTYSKLQNENYTMEIEKFDINELVTKVVLSFYDDIQAKNINPDIKFIEEPMWVYGNYEAYSRIIHNILINAMRHGKNSLELVLEQKNGRIHFWCKNDVENPDEIDIDKVFEQFYKSDVNRNHTSSGLGLSISNMLCERMGAGLTAQIEDKCYFVIHMDAKICDEAKENDG